MLLAAAAVWGGQQGPAVRGDLEGIPQGGTDGKLLPREDSYTYRQQVVDGHDNDTQTELVLPATQAPMTLIYGRIE